MKHILYKSMSNQLRGNRILFGMIMLLISSSVLLSPYSFGALVNNMLFNVLIIVSMLSIKKGLKKRFLWGIFLVTSINIISDYSDYRTLEYISEILKIGFFMVIVYELFIQVVKSEEVDEKTIFEAINVYLLFGVIGTLFAVIIFLSNPHAFVFSNIEDPRFSDFFYFSTITLTTIGYGDITPVSGAAKLLTMVLGISGQLYITLIMATLVGKLLNKKNG